MEALAPMPHGSPELFAFFFATPLAVLAAALGAVSLPVVIHLLSRRRFRVVTWAAMRFLLAAQRKNARRLRLEQLILLTVRVVLLLLLVAAMASVMPWVQPLWQRLFPASAAEAAHYRRTHKILVIDGSFSMAAKVGDRSCFEHARRKALEILDQSHGGDGFSVVLMANPPELIVPEASDDLDEVRTEIDEDNLYLPHGDANLGETLGAVENLLAESPSKFLDREVYFLTDLQRSTWIPRGPQGTDLSGNLAAQFKRIQETYKARTVIVDVGQDIPGNLAVTGLQLTTRLVAPRAVTPVTVTLHNYGREESKKVAIELWAGKAAATGADMPCELRPIHGGRAGAQDAAFELVDPARALEDAANPQEANFPPGADTLAVTFHVRFKVPGDYVVQVRLPHDALDLDNVRSLVVRVKTVRVLVVNGRPAGDPYEQGVGDLEDSLNPFNRGDPRRSEFPQPTIVDVPQFEDPRQCDLTPYDCVFLCNVPRLSEAQEQRLETHLRRGGGVVVCLGPQVDLDDYNRFLYKGDEGLLPGRLIARTPRGDEPKSPSFALHADTENYKRPPLDAFDEDAYRASLTRARIQNYIGVDQVRPRARTVLSFLPEWKLDERTYGQPRPEPAVVEWKRFRGRVVLLTTTASREWSKWAPGPTYPAFVQELLLFASGGRFREAEAIVGQPVQEIFDAAQAEREAHVAVLQPNQAREGEEISPHPRVGVLDPHLDACVLRLADTSTSGIYRVTVPPDRRESLFAVNVPLGSRVQPGSESDLTRTTRQALQEAYCKVKDSDEPFRWDLQLVTDPGQVVRRPVSRSGDEAVDDAPRFLPGTGVGTSVARALLLAMFGLLLLEVVLAWWFGHHSTDPASEQPPPSRHAPALNFVAMVVGGVAAGMLLALMGALVHYALTHTFLGFLPAPVRASILAWCGEPLSAAGEGVDVRLDYTPYLSGNPIREACLVAVLAIVVVILVGVVYFREGTKLATRDRLLLIGLRISLVLLTLHVLLPQLKLWFERQGLPVLAVIVDDSESMSEADRYPDAETRDAGRRLVQAMRLKPDGLQPDQPQRIQLVQAILDRDDPDWLNTLLQERRVRVHLFRLEDWRKGKPRVEINKAEDLDAALQAIREIQPVGKSSPLGNRISQVRARYRGSSLTALVMMTDGITTRGKKRLVEAAEEGVRRSRQNRKKVPLFFVGVGSKQENRPDVYLDELQVADEVYANDRLIFEAKIVAQGYPNLTVPVTLYERDGSGNLHKLRDQTVITNPLGTRVQFELKPEKPAGDRPYEEKFYVIDVPVQKEPKPEVDPDNNQLECTVVVHKAEKKPIGVLYVETAPRYEFRYLKNLLERELPDDQGNKRVDLRVLLLDADSEWPLIDRSALSLVDEKAFPREGTFPGREQLLDPDGFYDVVILGDVDPAHRKLGKENLKSLSDFVRQGGGLLLIAGDSWNPHAFRDTPLRDVLPIEIDPDGTKRDGTSLEGFRPRLTRERLNYPFLRFSAPEKDSQTIWDSLALLHWWSQGYRIKPGANVLAIHPALAVGGGERAAGGDGGHPLIVHQFVGAGRSLFFGIDETWRWRYRENESRYNDFWRQVVQHLWRRQSTYPRLRLERERLGQQPPHPGEPYRPGDLIRVTVNFPENMRPPDPDVPVKVAVQRKFANSAGQTETELQSLELTKVNGTPGSYRGTLTRTLAGDYSFRLAPLSATGVAPRAFCRVLSVREEDPLARRLDDPGAEDEQDAEHLYEEGEKARLSINLEDMQKAADKTGGAVFTLPQVDRLLDKLPTGKRVKLDLPSPPWLLWNHNGIFLLALALLGAEWVLRKRKHLL
jgi:hypothetical protein